MWSHDVGQFVCAFTAQHLSDYWADFCEERKEDRKSSRLSSTPLVVVMSAEGCSIARQQQSCVFRVVPR